jgi:hypothetical protein
MIPDMLSQPGCFLRVFGKSCGGREYVVLFELA